MAQPTTKLYSRRVKPMAAHASMIVFGILMLYPVFWWIGAAFKTNEELTSPNFLPIHPTWDNFINGWHAVPNYSFSHFYANTLILVAVLIVTSLLSCSLVAFGFARLDFALKGFWFSMLLMTLMLPHQVTMVPQYVLFNNLGWVNTYLPFMVPHALAGGIGGSFFVFLLVQFVRGIPRELDESAKLDGCSWFGIYWRIVMPLMKPAMVTVMIYCFLWNWDDFFGHLIYINSVDKYTVGLALRLMMDSQSETPWGQLLAMSLISILPSVLIFLTSQRHFVEGIATTGLKG